jgi:hypothetical protein
LSHHCQGTSAILICRFALDPAQSGDLWSGRVLADAQCGAVTDTRLLTRDAEQGLGSGDR